MSKSLRSVVIAGALAILASASTVVAPATASADEYPKQCLQGRVICIDKTTRTVDWMIDGELHMSMDARFGSRGTPTRDGLFKVYRKSEKHVSRLYGASMPYALFFDGGQAVHYSADFASRGYDGASRGCVNTRSKTKMKRLFDAVHLGDKVYVYGSEKARKREADGPKGYYDPSAPWY